MIGTAGHVDHGKTALIKRLTGVDTDRLKAEKERGITTELGFASLSLPDGRSLGVVDVPGHERFVRHMVAGAAGIDLVVLVIAADEGVMPQTREHLQICSLLEIKKGFVALTKTDTVDQEWLILISEDIREFLSGTFLDGTPIIPISSLTGAGFSELTETIARIADQVERQTDVGLFRLPVDRVFTMRGFGTVVTGTLASGKVAIGEEVEISPVRLRAKVRGIQVHSRSVEAAEAGQRTAINLQGIDKDLIERGYVLSGPESLVPALRFDGFYCHLSSASWKLKHRSLVRFHTGTSEVMARVILLDREELSPGEEAAIQLVLEAPLAVVAGDRFVIRSYSPMATIGGGMICDPLPRKHKRRTPTVLEEFRHLVAGTEREKLAVILGRAGIEGITETRLALRAGICRSELRKHLETMFSRKEAILADREANRVLGGPVYRAILEGTLREVKAYHERNPLKEGLFREELRMTLVSRTAKGLHPKTFNMILHDLEREGKIVAGKEEIRLAGHQVRLQGEMGDLRAKLTDLYRKSGLTPPTAREIQERFGDYKKEVASLLQLMTRDGELVRISGDLHFHREALERLREQYRQQLMREGEATPASFRDMAGLTRKFIIPLMEYFDMTKLTIRVGDRRILREKEGQVGT
ncbi:MAG: selenocysteine-specific translation elongation factor [Syntrophaceae bacterium]|nr:selenocysteine-specific translation elongation factor [Syntrophaceae bacterium]